MRTKILFLTSFFYMLALAATAQEVRVNEDAERPLVWSDFKGKPDKASAFYAQTYWDLAFSSAGLIMDGENVSPKSVVLILKFNGKKSWLKNGKGTEELLKHEQGHFDLARLCQLDMLATLKKTIFTRADFQAKTQEIFDEIFARYRKLDQKYDEESNHSINAEKQEEWNKFFPAEKQRLLKLNE